jgi:hypothetical protein
MTTVNELIANKTSFRHHALLLLSNHFSTSPLPEADFKSLIQAFCGMTLYENKEETVYQVAARHPDIFIAERERKILRLEDIKQIRDFSLYPPQQSLSSKISLVLPTITSRVQKVALSFPNENQPNIKEKFSVEDRMWIKNKIEHFQLKNYSTASLAPAVRPRGDLEKTARGDERQYALAEIITYCEKLSKEYHAEDLRALLVTLINEKVKQDFNFIHIAKLFLSNISEWKNYENYHPSTALWLIRAFLIFS